MGDEMNAVGEGQSADDVLQNQPANALVSQLEELIEGNEDRAVNDEPLDDNMLQEPQEEDIYDISTFQQPSNLESWNLVEQDG